MNLCMKDQFFELQSTGLFRQRLERVLDTHVSPYSFWAPGTGWLRDAIAAKWFAEKTAAKLVGLIPGAQPDFEVQYRNGTRLQFEATLADMPARKMARDERIAWDKNETVRTDTGRDWSTRRKAIPEALETASKRKAHKAERGLYPSDTNLLIYLNLGTYDRWRDEIELELVEHTKLARPHFRSIWVLWSSRLYRTWPDPFLGSATTFRPPRHELGKAVNFHRSKLNLEHALSNKIER